MTKFTKANWITRQLAENLCVMGEQLENGENEEKLDHGNCSSKSTM